ncbi:MAG: FAD-binding protein [Halovenus sp.]
MQNVLEDAATIRSDGFFARATPPDARINVVDTRDVARVAARALLDSGHRGKTHKPTGPEPITFAQMASAMVGLQVAFGKDIADLNNDHVDRVTGNHPRSFATPHTPAGGFIDSTWYRVPCLGYIPIPVQLATMTDAIDEDVLIIGGGPSGLSAGIFTARAGLKTLIVNDGDPILRRNAHLENYPGFPAGVNSRLLLDMMSDQAERAGCERREARVTDLEPTDGGFIARTDDDRTVTATYVIAATKNTVDFMTDIDGIETTDRGKTFVETDERGRTGVPGLYAAGRLALQPYQTIIVAGHGASVGVAVVEDSDVPFYHDWVAPEGYFTGRDRTLPPGTEEIDEDERTRRERESLEVMRDYFAELHSDEPNQHPSVREK